MLVPCTSGTACCITHLLIACKLSMPLLGLPLIAMQPWRDCYSFACVLKASLDLQQQQQHIPHQDAQSDDARRGTGGAEQHRLAGALKQLDLGIMMGGPAFRWLHWEAGGSCSDAGWRGAISPPCSAV